MSNPNLFDTVEKDVSKYSEDDINEILLQLNISIAEVSSISEFQQECDNVISYYLKQNNIRGNFIADFLKNVKTDERILNLINKKKNDLDLINKENEYSDQNMDDDQQYNWWSEQALKQQDSNQADKQTERKQQIGLYDNDHNVMQRVRLGVNQNHDIPIVQGQINPNLTNTIRKLVILDSQFRQNSFPAKENLKFNDILSPHKSIYSSTDYTADLTDILTNVLSLKLYEVSIPFSWYEVDFTNSNTCFVIEKESGESYLIQLQPGNYQASTSNLNERNNIYAALNTTIENTIEDYDYTYGFCYDILTGKTLFISKTNDITLIWYSTTNEYYKQCNIKSCSNDARENNNLGYTLGYRNTEYDTTDYETLTTSFTIYTDTSSATFEKDDAYILESESVIDLYGTKYLLLVIDDYNQNHLNKGMISIESKTMIPDLPKYYNPSHPCVKLYTSNNTLVNGDETDDSINRSNTYNYQLSSCTEPMTQAQLDTVNSINQDRSRLTQEKIQSVTASNLFAIIPVKRTLQTNVGEGLVEFSGPIQVNERIYFGPVNIERLRIRLLNDKGHLLNLNGRDWSFTLQAELLYQY